MAYKAVGAPTLDLLDLICERKVQMIMFEDNTATIQIIKAGKNPTMIYISRTCGVSMMWLHEMFKKASAFNQDIGGWAIQSVRNMNWMFRYASSFNQDISGWAVDAVKSMSLKQKN